jgi:hypothetical protein
MEITPTQKKLKRKIVIIRVIGIVLIAFQLIAYLGNIDEPAPERPAEELIGYYFGYNFFLWIGIIMLIWSFNVRKKLRQVKQDELMNTIGNNELT